LATCVDAYVVSVFNRTVDAYVASGFPSADLGASSQAGDDRLPELTEPVNDFAHIIDPPNAAAMDRMIRQLQAATGDVVVVATVQTIEPYGDIREYANKLFENHGRGIGDKEKKNGLLILVAIKERKVWIEVGYGLEEFVTDGFAGETSREDIVPEFRSGQYGAGLRAGTARIIARLAQARNVTLDGVRAPARRPQSGGTPFPLATFLILLIAVLVISRVVQGSRAGVRRWGRGGWSGWSSGVGGFGGGWRSGGGGGGGGSFGGGFSGFGGGSSGGGGGGASW
jgi:uncharacterized protein